MEDKIEQNESKMEQDGQTEPKGGQREMKKIRENNVCYGMRILFIVESEQAKFVGEIGEQTHG